MPSYEICYRSDDGTLETKVAANCANDLQAKVLAHAMKERGMKRIEVWDGEVLVYERPHHFQ
ncbi:MAG: hypothetical protein KGI68_03330 [Alphaproteobacteria bacterium]|nr:hypothetical protein [Alphaproteobacteria bacterium]MDE1985027.1 hypothetical protein [Alphaproteobacteria bacterium]MDE2162368.1 hypothetical protein [Alphaproteobacteria bacterium]MDE2265522.1 hypothetical protein [Alphaproteobacteria bacterium]MDE2498712.1 hypothetical protein [Alphaproteobacteria bacterium]